MVDITLRPFFQQQVVTPDNIANVAEVAPQLQISGRHLGWLGAGLNVRNLPRQTRTKIGVRLPGAGVVEWASANNRQAIASVKLISDHFPSRFAGGVRIRGPERTIFTQRHGVFLTTSVDLSGTHIKNSAIKNEAPAGIKQIERAKNIYIVGYLWIGQ